MQKKQAYTLHKESTNYWNFEKKNILSLVFLLKLKIWENSIDWWFLNIFDEEFRVRSFDKICIIIRRNSTFFVPLQNEGKAYNTTLHGKMEFDAQSWRVYRRL